MARVLGEAAPPAGGIDFDVPGNDVRLAATRWPGSGTPVVLLHGLSSQRRFWNLVVPSLAGLPVLALDQRGHGGSDRPAEGYDVGDAAGDLAAAFDAIGWSRAVVVGHSWGGAVAASFAAAHPERVLSVVCIDGGFTSPPPDADLDIARKRLEPPRLAMPPEELEAMLRQHAPTAWSAEVAAAVLPIFAVGDDGLARARLPFDTHMQIVDGMLRYDAPATLEQVRCPLWLVSCEPPGGEPEVWSRAKHEALDRLSSALPNVRALRWGGAVHDVPLQWPALVAGLVRAAVDGVRPAQP
ncbi:MAG TPA: alpha/beta hydrolase [Mycobacteriales bacterium]|nr:alpha/beta hydrolase [Mycobacteriales bacterium]